MAGEGEVVGCGVGDWWTKISLALHVSVLIIFLIGKTILLNMLST